MFFSGNGNWLRSALLATTGLTLLGGAEVKAQEAPQKADAAIEEVVVTGSRIVRDGYDAPTPVTVVGAEALQDNAAPNVSELVMTLPATAGNIASGTTWGNVSGGGNGLNTPVLRNLGTQRTLILLDGHRVVGSTQTGEVDLNTIPQQLISRVDVVTGGASAAYGSDALAGVINFGIDHNFTGVKGKLEGQITTYGDDQAFDLSLTAGMPFANDRGHLLIAGEVTRNYGIQGSGGRAWQTPGIHIVANPAYGTGPGLSTGVPAQIVVQHAIANNMTMGGIITSGPLKGIAFGPGGTPYQFNYGTVAGPWSIDPPNWEANEVQRDGQDLETQDARQNFYTRASFDFSDNFKGYAEFNWSYDHARMACCDRYASGDLPISIDNPFIPDSVRQQGIALGVTSFMAGSYLRDLGKFITDNVRYLHRYLIGGDGKVDIFDQTWSYSIYAQHGNSGSTQAFSDRWKSTYLLALDAVRAPSGAIVCRSTLTNPTNGCVPFNPFGIGVNTQAAVNYSSGWSYAHPTMRQDVYSFSINGNPLSTWAGPVSVATGVEHRLEKAGGIADARTNAQDSFIGDTPPTIGSYSVTEGFVETVIPLAKDTSWARALDFNGAVRATGYTTSGYVTTWKAGGSYTPVDDIRFRLTQSRDIRAPNNVELYGPGSFAANLVLDPFNNNKPTNILGGTFGNPLLQPEKADTTGFGAVLQPSFVPGFAFSADYFNIKINDVIGTVGRQDVPNRCFAGETQFCSSLVFQNGALYIVKSSPTNFITRTDRGIDFDLTYQLKLDSIVDGWSGNLQLKGFASLFLKETQDTGSGVGIVSTVGNGAVRKWKYTVSLSYTNEDFRASLTGRGFSPGVLSVTNIQCQSNCPVSTNMNVTINDNHEDGALYFDTSLRYKFLHLDSGDADVFLNVHNLFNKDPFIVPMGPQGASAFGASACSQPYDCVGRVFRMGVDFKM